MMIMGKTRCGKQFDFSTSFFKKLKITICNFYITICNFNIVNTLKEKNKISFWVQKPCFSHKYGICKNAKKRLQQKNFFDFLSSTFLEFFCQK